MAATAFPFFEIRFLTDAGAPAALYKLEQYISGTTSNQQTFTDVAGTVPNALPLTLDATGRCTMYGTPGQLYTFVLKHPTTGAVIRTWNDVAPAPAAVAGAFVPLDGSIAMSGLLTLSGDPTSSLNAASKQYVDAAVSAAISSFSTLAAAATAAAAAATAAAAGIKPPVYIISSAANGAVSRDIVDPTPGTYSLTLYSAASHPNPAATPYDLTATQNAGFGTATLSTSIQLKKQASDTQSTYGSAVATGTLTVSGTGTFTLSMDAASLNGLTGRGAFLIAALQ